MGSGIAKQIRERWPEVYEHYRKVYEDYVWGGRPRLLGTVDLARINGSTRYVVNMFSQDACGYDGARYTSYDAFANALYEMMDTIPLSATIGFPKNIGCGLGGANWKIISAMIEAILGKGYNVYIYELEGA
jgi:O-acetyl-ADP-ribose deacetylase (regulator of RNase III)